VTKNYQFLLVQDVSAQGARSHFSSGGNSEAMPKVSKSAIASTQTQKPSRRDWVRVGVRKRDLVIKLVIVASLLITTTARLVISEK
jgi:hypothetical protein